VSRPLAGRRYFEAQGRSLRSRGVPNHQVRNLFRRAPLWVRSAVARGYIWQGLRKATGSAS